MGWVSCLEDNQERLDDILNAIQGLSTSANGSTLYEISRMRQSLHDLQDQLNNLVEIVTDPEMGSKIELYELRQAYEQTKLQNQQLREHFSEEQKQCINQRKEIEAMSRQLIEISMSWKAERAIAENSTAKYYEEQQRRERVEAELQTLKSGYPPESTLELKKRSRKR